ncbi:hypothetical protein QJQ45_011159 [Haematococcus lacustris]|nr:hypothetical protein QJQ45_011159 [Haematococcus lacustris]
MKDHSNFGVVLIAIVASWATVCRAGDATGSGFPYFDNCRSSLSETRFDVRLTSEAVNPVNGSVFCWTVYVKPATACLSPQRRCCSTSFAKVKLYTSRPALQQELQCDASDSATDKLQCDSIRDASWQRICGPTFTLIPATSSFDITATLTPTLTLSPPATVAIPSPPPNSSGPSPTLSTFLSPTSKPFTATHTERSISTAPWSCTSSPSCQASSTPSSTSI